MYSDMIAMADMTLAANRRLRKETAELRARRIALALQCRGRLPLLVGKRRCAVCCGAIKSGEGRYRVGLTEFHRNCFKFWLVAPSTPRDDLIEFLVRSRLIGASFTSTPLRTMAETVSIEAQCLAADGSAWYKK